MSTEELNKKFLADAKKKFGNKITATSESYGMAVVDLLPEIHRDFALWCKTDPEWEFNHFIDITSIDYMNTREQRFKVVVHLRSHKLNYRIRFQTPVDGENPVLDSLTPVYVGASWTEREIYDLMGITFNDHPRMTRIFLPDDYVGHPLRKDFPVKGPDRGSFPKGMIISNKRREPTMTKQTRPSPLDQKMPRNPQEMKREPIRKEAESE